MVFGSQNERINNKGGSVIKSALEGLAESGLFGRSKYKIQQVLGFHTNRVLYRYIACQNKSSLFFLDCPWIRLAPVRALRALPTAMASHTRILVLKRKRSEYFVSRFFLQINFF